MKELWKERQMDQSAVAGDWTLQRRTEGGL